MIRGLIIRAPWIDLILQGKKTWEMRSKPTHIRETIGLIRKGSGLIVGAATLIDSRPPLTRENYMDHRDKHAIPESMLEEVLENRWVYPWVLSDIRAYEKPARSNHIPGGVTFVFLNSTENGAGTSEPAAAAAQKKPPRPTQPSPIAQQPGRSASSPSVSSLARSGSNPDDEPLFVFRPETAHACGRPLPTGEFIVLKGSTAMRRGSANVKRDADERDRLIRAGVLVQDVDADLYRFAIDHIFSSSSKAAGIIKDGNASGPSLWQNAKTGLSLKDYKSKL